MAAAELVACTEATRAAVQALHATTSLTRTAKQEQAARVLRAAEAAARSALLLLQAALASFGAPIPLEAITQLPRGRTRRGGRKQRDGTRGLGSSSQKATGSDFEVAEAGLTLAAELIPLKCVQQLKL